MKQLVSLILTTLLLYGFFGPLVLVADNFNTTITDEEVSSPPTTSPSAITLTHFNEPDPINAVAFAKGTSREEIINWLGDNYFTGYDDYGQYYDLRSNDWSLDAININEPGLYYASISPDLEEDYLLTDGVSLPQQLYAISIQIPGELDIHYASPGRGFLRFPWIFSLEQSNHLSQLEALSLQDTFATVQLRENNGEWAQLNEGFIFVSDALHLSQHIFDSQGTYDLKVAYPGGQTGVLTFKYDGRLDIISYSEGSRDGGNVSGNDLPGSFQPAPHPPSSQTTSNLPVDVPIATPTYHEPSEEETFILAEFIAMKLKENPISILDKLTSITQFVLPKSVAVYVEEVEPNSVAPLNPVVHTTAIFPGIIPQSSIVPPHVPSTDSPIVPPVVPSTDCPIVPSDVPSTDSLTVQELFSPEQTIITGLRLRDLCADQENIVFGSGDLTVSIPGHLLSALNLSDSDTLSVSLTQPGTNQVKFLADAFGKPLPKLLGTTLRLRYTPQSENAEIIVQNELEQEIKDTSFDGEFLRFAANTTGTYTVLEISQPLDTPRTMSPILPLLGGLTLAGSGATLVWRKHHG